MLSIPVKLKVRHFLKIFCEFFKLEIDDLKSFNVWFMSFGQSQNWYWMSNICYCYLFFSCGRVLPFGAHSSLYKYTLTQKRPFLVIGTTFRSNFHVGWKNQNKHSPLSPNDMNQGITKCTILKIVYHFAIECPKLKSFINFSWSFYNLQ